MTTLGKLLLAAIVLLACFYSATFALSYFYPLHTAARRFRRV
jgi:hypothetical protein